MTGGGSTARPVLIVGRSGQLATDLARTASKAGTPYRAIGRPELDITDPELVSRVVDRIAPKAVINAAAYTLVDKAEAEPELAFALNGDGPGHLARACSNLNIPLIHVSTDQVFDGRRAGGHRETEAPNPLSVYGRSKLAGEDAVASGCDQFLIVRVSWVFGPSADNFVKKCLAWAREREVLTIVSDQRGRPTYGPDLAAALMRLAERMVEGGPSRPHGLLHLAGESVMTRYEQVEQVMRASAARGGPRSRVLPVLTKDYPTAALRPLNAELDVSFARTRYGLALGTFEDDLRRMLDKLGLAGPA